MEARFIGESISVEWDKPPFLEKKPTCPDRFIWDSQTLEIVELLSEWRDYQRNGRMGMNMRPEHLRRARERGSWGVGRFYFRVRVADGRSFELYYDRAAISSDRRKGAWFLNQELL
ncbi:MAG: hypothetical protein GWP61_22445 [Chloroflexi bacterium]|jgi:hypothetical protein|nr:hypothetical protein [Chloroflexota bacterium]